MKYKTLIKKLRLSDEDFKTIKNAVAEAEAKTTGEIAVAVTPESARYCFWELLAADFLVRLYLSACFLLQIKFWLCTGDFTGRMNRAGFCRSFL
jgi:putative membrane protein